MTFSKDLIKTQVVKALKEQALIALVTTLKNTEISKMAEINASIL